MNLEAVPVPRDIPLPLPADPVLLQALLVVLFLLHILFVNLMLGGSLLTVGLEILGLRRREYDRLAHEVAATVTVNKSLAVVLGVGPLLAINVLYTLPFYTANALTGAAWMSMVPLVILAFLITYAHKYTWERLEDAKGLHIAIGLAGAGLFLFIPLIFLANVNLMLFPDRWTDVRGFFSALVLPNVWPRYLHFLTASVAVTGLFLIIDMTRAAYPVEERLPEFDRPRLRRTFYGIALGATLLQLLFGPLLLFTLPSIGMSGFLLLVVTFGASCGIAAMVVMWQEIVRPAAQPQTRLAVTVALITATAFAMGYGRHVYRENALQEHRARVAEATRVHGWELAAASWRAATGEPLEQVPPGRKVFEGTCAACHAVDRVLVGPSLVEIAGVYAGDVEGLMAWTEQPGRKRPGFPPMPAFKLGDEKLRAVAAYILELGAGVDAGPEPDRARAAEPPLSAGGRS
ncbi:MAG: cytochrome c [Candidatus Krumholzibacteriia bacterium]